jgi:uncharacterized membrane protein
MKTIVLILLVVSVFGIADTTYLTAEHYKEGAVQCLVGGDCDLVLRGDYSEIFGIPTALIGLAYYFLLFIFSLFYFYNQKGLIRLAFYLTMAGFLASLFFVYLQVFVINALCSYCIVSAILNAVLFICGVVGLKKGSV